MRLPSDVFPRAARRTPADLTSAGGSLFPALPQPTSVAETAAATQPSFDVSRICEAFTFPVTYAAAVDQLVLKRTNQKRLGLLIVNVNIIGGIFYCFDTDANNVNAIPIANGGNRLFDTAVPQGDLHIFASGAGQIVIEYLLPSTY